jgi:hypothetical protein
VITNHIACFPVQLVGEVQLTIPLSLVSAISAIPEIDKIVLTTRYEAHLSLKALDVPSVAGENAFLTPRNK